MKREFSGIPGIPTGIPIGILDMGMTTEIRIGNKMNIKVIWPYIHAIWSYNERWDFPRAGSSLFLPRFSGLTFLRFLGPFFIFSEIFTK